MFHHSDGLLFTGGFRKKAPTLTSTNSTQQAAITPLPFTTHPDIWAEPFLHTPINTSCFNNSPGTPSVPDE